MVTFERLTRNRLQHFASVLNKKHRHATGLFHIEGLHLFDEFLKSGFEADWIVVHTDFIKQHPVLANTIKNKFPSITFQANSAEFKKVSDTTNAQGIAAGIHQKRLKEPVFSSSRGDLIVALDHVSDPGNVGAIIRSADWFGIRNVILSPSCADVYNPKAIRASMGSIFRVTCLVMELSQFLAEAKEHRYRTYAAALDPQASELKVEMNSSCVVVIGNEAHGISEEIRQICSHRIKIPKYGLAESLNAAMAGSILMYEFSKQLGKKNIEADH